MGAASIDGDGTATLTVDTIAFEAADNGCAAGYHGTAAVACAADGGAFAYTGCTDTGAPAPPPAPPANSITAQLTLEMDMPADAELPAFRTSFKEGVANAMEIAADKVIITNIAAGSVIVDFYIAPADDGTALVAADAVSTTLTTGVTIAGVQLTAESLTTTPTLVTAPEPEPEPEPESGLQEEEQVNLNQKTSGATATAARLSAFVLALLFTIHL